MSSPFKTLILSGYGTNCEQETAHACRLAGGGDGVEVAHMSRIYQEGLSLDPYHFIVFIGGFLDGDDLGSGRACANRFRYRPLPGGGTFLEDLWRYADSGRLMLGICNGFQLLTKMGLLPGNGERPAGGPPAQTVSLAKNANNRFEDRWVRLAVESHSPCVFTQGMTGLELPVRHGEGRLAAQGEGVAALVRQGLVPLRYANAQGAPTETYPHNPNGSPLGAAALCNKTGTVMGLMPHPEAFWDATNHPGWTRQPGTPGTGEGQGLALFKNGYRYLQSTFA
ncbi:MAG: phosphoribosylformylglycinamidine synthase subunit PurQ [Deltaproteobacteria bacterium]|nr:phosphoribosylformylglycinamidine synthase subunit PurQ [Deltaproteobacteria bacterium]